MEQPTLGIIGGSGLYALEALSSLDSVDIDTPFGKPSDPIRIGTISGRKVAFLSRHGAGHRLSPSEVPYAANVCALKMVGVERVVSISAVGSLQEEIAPRSFVVPDSTIDRTTGRKRTFFAGGAVAHVSMADPFCPALAGDVAAAAQGHPGGLPVTVGGTYVCIEGPQFSTRAESELFRSWGAGVIGMTALPEARLAREAELCYACLAMVTDYDVWHSSEQAVSVDLVIENLLAMTAGVQQIVQRLAGAAFGACDNGCRTALNGAIISDRASIPDEVVERLLPIAGRHLSDPGSSA